MQTARPESLGFSAARLERIDAAMQRYIDEGKAAGVVTVVGRKGRIAHIATLGMCDIASGKRMREDTIFRIYSMSKPITAVAVMMLYEQGYFLLDDPVARFIPEFGQMKVFAGETADGIEVAAQQQPMTIRHLLTHTSGLPYGKRTGTAVEKIHAEAIDSWPDIPLEEYARRIPTLPLAHQPGAAWMYGISIDILGRVVEVVSGETFDVFLQERLFDPLRMVDTAFYVPEQKLERLATVYTHGARGALEKRADDGPRWEEGERPAFLSGGGGLLSTAPDYARFCQMLANGGELDGERYLSPRTIRLMAGNHLPPSLIPFAPADFQPPFPGFGFGLGVATLMDPALFGIPASAGTFTWGGAASTGMWVDPGEELYGVTMLQIMPFSYHIFREHQILTYQALVD